LSFFFVSTGHCITAATAGDACGLDSFAVACDENGWSATACRCYQTPTVLDQEQAASQVPTDSYATATLDVNSGDAQTWRTEFKECEGSSC